MSNRISAMMEYVCLKKSMTVTGLIGDSEEPLNSKRLNCSSEVKLIRSPDMGKAQHSLSPPSC